MLHPRMRSVLSGSVVNRILVPAQDNDAVGEPMSLYRAGLKLALFLPLGVAMPPSFSRTPSGFADVSSVVIRTSRPGATLLIEPPSVSPRLQDLRT